MALAVRMVGAPLEEPWVGSWVEAEVAAESEVQREAKKGD